MDKKEVSPATVAKRMNRILDAYREQCAQETQTDDGTTPVASTSSSSSASSSASPPASGEKKDCPPERKQVLDKAILNYAAQTYSESESDAELSDHSYTFNESPPKRRCISSILKTVTVNEPKSKRRRSQPSRTVKRATVKLTSLPSKRTQRKVTCTKTSSKAAASSASASPDHQSSSSNDDSDSDTPMALVFPDSDDDSDAVTKPKQSKVTKPKAAVKSSIKPTKSIKSSIIIKTTSKSTCIKPM